MKAVDSHHACATLVDRVVVRSNIMESPMLGLICLHLRMKIIFLGVILKKFNFIFSSINTLIGYYCVAYRGYPCYDSHHSMVELWLTSSRSLVSHSLVVFSCNGVQNALSSNPHTFLFLSSLALWSQTFLSCLS